VALYIVEHSDERTVITQSYRDGRLHQFSPDEVTPVPELHCDGYYIYHRYDGIHQGHREMTYPPLGNEHYVPETNSWEPGEGSPGDVHRCPAEIKKRMGYSRARYHTIDGHPFLGIDGDVAVVDGDDAEYPIHDDGTIDVDLWAFPARRNEKPAALPVGKRVIVGDLIGEVAHSYGTVNAVVTESGMILAYPTSMSVIHEDADGMSQVRAEEALPDDEQEAISAITAAMNTSSLFGHRGTQPGTSISHPIRRIEDLLSYHPAQVSIRRLVQESVLDDTIVKWTVEGRKVFVEDVEGTPVEIGGILPTRRDDDSIVISWDGEFVNAGAWFRAYPGPTETENTIIKEWLNQ
jgi:hypothetical protein